MERATALARLYESVNSIPEDIQQCLLQIAQYGCDPEQVKRWYLLVREHFGVLGPDFPKDVRMDTNCSTTPPASMEVPVELSSVPAISRPASTSSHATAASHAGSVTGYMTHQDNRQFSERMSERPRTPSMNQSAVSWTSPSSVRSRADSGHVSKIAQHPAPDTMTNIEPLAGGWNDFVNSPDNILGSGLGNSPNFSETGNLQTFGGHFTNQAMETNPRYDLAITSASMPPPIQPEQHMNPAAVLNANHLVSHMPPPQFNAPPLVSVAPRERTQKRRRAPRKSVREMMEQHQLRNPRRPQTQYRPHDVVYELPQQPPAAPQTFPGQPFFHPMQASGPQYQVSPFRFQTPVPSIEQSRERIQSNPFPQPQLVIPQPPLQSFQGSQSCPLPQQPFSTEPGPSPFFDQNHATSAS